MSTEKPASKKRSHAVGSSSIEAQFPGAHAPDCQCAECVAVRDEEARLKKEADEAAKTRKKLAKKEGRLRRFYGRMARFRVGAVTFGKGLHDATSAVLSLITVVVIVDCLWLLTSRLHSGDYIVPAVSLVAIVVIGRLNERLG